MSVIAVLFFKRTALLNFYCPVNLTMEITLLKESQSTDVGRIIQYPHIDSPLVSVFSVALSAEEQSGWHIHYVPVYAYVQSGKLEFQIQDLPSRLYQYGDVIFEPVGVPINVINKGSEPVVAIVIKLGGLDEVSTIYSN